jgi:hypothetical protein
MDRTPGSDDMIAEYEQDRIDRARDASWLDDDEEDDDEEGEEQRPYGSDGKLRVLSDQCSTCVFRPGNPMHLNPGRLRDLVQQNLAADAALVCHQTLTYGDHPEFGPALCRGFFDAYGQQVNVVRIMGRLGGINDTIAPPTKESTP